MPSEDVDDHSGWLTAYGWVRKGVMVNWDESQTGISALEVRVSCLCDSFDAKTSVFLR